MIFERQTELDHLIAAPFAHRGLHGDGRVENSRAAFEAAISSSYGIELDVQVAADKEAYVFHDHYLDRLTHASGPFGNYPSSDLRSLRLRGCDETIPTLREVLQLVAARVPLLIELKASRATADELSRDVFRALEGYRGAVGVMSYHPRVGRWFDRNAPQRIRGLVIRETGNGALRKPLLRQLALWRVNPDFLAYRIADLPSRFASTQRANGLRILAWTVRTMQDRARAGEYADQIIFENAPR